MLNKQSDDRWFETKWRLSGIAVMYMSSYVFVLLLRNKLVWWVSHSQPMLQKCLQKGKLQDERHIKSLSSEKSSKYEGGHNAGTLHSAWQCPVLQFLTFPRTCRRLSAWSYCNLELSHRCIVTTNLYSFLEMISTQSVRWQFTQVYYRNM